MDKKVEHVSPAVRLKEIIGREKQTTQYDNSKKIITSEKAFERSLCVGEATALETSVSWFRWLLIEEMKKYAKGQAYNGSDIRDNFRKMLRELEVGQ